MRIAVMTDVHGNLAALEAVLDDIKQIKCESIISLGDAIAIGPYPKDALDLMLKYDVVMIRGNHEMYYLMDDAELKAVALHEGEYEHQKWVRETLGDGYREMVAQMPWDLHLTLQGHKFYFAHYALQDQWYHNFVNDPDGDDLYQMFHQDVDYVFFGHHHPKHDVVDEKRKIRYLNPGSLGCTKSDQTQYLVLDIDETVTVLERVVTYDRKKTLDGFESEKVPEGQFIKKFFFGESL